MAIDATVGGSASNSYLTLSQANDYFANRLYSTDWTGATDPNKEAALIMATQLLDANTDFTGAIASDTQALSWPRSGMVTRNGVAIPEDELPADLKNATAELALSLLKTDRTAESDVEAQGITKIKAGPVELNFSGDGAATIIPSNVRALMPASWIVAVEDASLRSIVFEAL